MTDKLDCKIVDCHCHILPGIDDGPPDRETSLQMLRQAEQTGTSIIIATPHYMKGVWEPAWPDICRRVEELQEVASQQGLAVQILPGCEVYADMAFLDHLGHSPPPAYCLAGSSYMLVEFPVTGLPRYSEDFLFRLQTRGIRPVIAHVERYPELYRDPSLIAQWCQRGMFFQLNVNSLTGLFGPDTVKVAARLFEGGHCHILASDAHSSRGRNPDLGGLLKRLPERWRPALTVLLANGSALLNDQPLQSAPAVMPAKRRWFGWLGR
ncbi:MAG: hypothetical protein N3A57_05500 [Negativicutes bacterium]|nr:hypothetical protein [Negativicutes bacterium]